MRRARILQGRVGKGQSGGQSGTRSRLSEPEVVAVGSAVANALLDVAVRPSGEQQHWSNDAAGIVGAIAWLQSVHPSVIVVEASRDYEAPVVAELGLAGLPVAVVTSRQVRDFARATGRLAKTDRLDAQGDRHTSPPLCVPSHDRCPTRRPRSWRRWSCADAKWWRCGPPNRTDSPRCGSSRCALASRRTWRGWTANGRMGTTSCVGACAPPRCGVSGTTCCAASLASAPSSR
jgi:hypothetical protein